MGGSRKEAILFERAVASGATRQTTSFSAIDNLRSHVIQRTWVCVIIVDSRFMRV